MIIQDLFEYSASKDMQVYREVDAIRGALIRFLFDGSPDDHYGFKALRFENGNVFLTLRGKQIGLDQKYADLWFMFGTEKPFTDQSQGGFSRLKRSGEPIIMINNFPDIFDVEAVRTRIIHSHYVHKMLEHELIHYLDNFRNPTMLDPSRAKYQDKKNGQRPRAYWQSPEEFNAYSTNIGQPLLAFIHAAQSGEVEPNRLAAFAAGLKIHKDFKQTLENLYARMDSNLKEFVKRVGKKGRQALVKRLYTLHQEALKYLA